MAKKLNKTTAPAVKATVEKSVTTPAPAPATRNRKAVLLKKTAAELRELIGADTPIGVSAKELKNLILSQHADKVLSDAGL